MSKSQPIILFDIDKTLIDIGKLFTEECITHFTMTFSLTKEEYFNRQEAYKKSLAKSTDFEPGSFLHAISHRENNDTVATQTFYNPVLLQKTLYDDVIPVLSELSQHWRLGIYSEGNQNWQLQKLKLTSILHFFDPDITYIWRRKTDPSNLELLPDSCFVVDDNVEVIKNLSKINSIKTILIARDRVIPDSSVPTISSLYELKNIVTN